MVLADGILPVVADERVRLIDPRVTPEEAARRRWLTRPDPDWHAARRVQFERANEPFAAALQRGFEHRARAVLAAERFDTDTALAHLIAAAASHPKPAGAAK